MHNASFDSVKRFWLSREGDFAQIFYYRGFRVIPLMQVWHRDYREQRSRKELIIQTNW